MWTCELQAPPASNLAVMLNKTIPLSPMGLTGKDSLEMLCDKEPHIFYQVKENPEHECYSLFTVRVVVCAAEEGVQGDYSIQWGDQNNIAEGSTVSIDLLPPRPTPADDTGAVQVHMHVHKSKEGKWRYSIYMYNLAVGHTQCTMSCTQTNGGTQYLYMYKDKWRHLTYMYNLANGGTQ